MSQPAWYRNPEMIIALSALVVSLFTVFVGAYSAWVDRAYARAAVWPRLEMGQSYAPGRFGYFVSNRGTGPALIKTVRMTVNGQPMRDWSAVLTAMGAGDRHYMQSQISRRTLSAGQDIQAFQTEDEAMIRLLTDASSPTTEVTLCYCSIYDQCWSVDQANRPVEVGRCDLPDEEQFVQ